MPQSGQLWSSTTQIGKETTAGTAVAATRKTFFREPVLTRERNANEYRFATGTRDNVRGMTLGPIMAGGSLALPMSADEILELLLLGIQGGVTPTTPVGATNARLWTFKPSTTLDSATIEWDDGAQLWQGKGMRVNSLTISGSGTEANDVSVDLFGTDLVTLGALTGALSDRVPTFLEGWQTRLYVDAFGGTPGSTLAPGMLRNWNVQINNQMDRVYTADNTLAANRVTSGELQVTCTLTFDATSAKTIAEFANWDAQTKRLVRLEFVDAASSIETGANELQTVTITGTPTGGTFTPSFMGTAGTTVAYNATASAFQAVLEAIPTIGTGNVTVGGGPGPGTPYTVTFVGRWAEYNVPLLTFTNAFTGGTTPSIAAVETTPGRSGRRFVTIDLPGGWSTVNLGGSANGVRTYEFGLMAIYDAALASMVQIRAQNARATAF